MLLYEEAYRMPYLHPALCISWLARGADLSERDIDLSEFVPYHILLYRAVRLGPLLG